jgi:hypothetical protein
MDREELPETKEMTLGCDRKPPTRERKILAFQIPGTD